MGKPGKRPAAPAQVDVECACGRKHKLQREQILIGLGVRRRKCKHCGQRFVIACTPGDEKNPETFWPLFLDQVPSLGDTQEVGIATEPVPKADVPSEVHFKCRCGCRLVGKPRMYGKRTRCPKCSIRIVVTPAFDEDAGTPVARVEYPEETKKR